MDMVGVFLPIPLKNTSWSVGIMKLLMEKQNIFQTCSGIQFDYKSHWPSWNSPHVFAVTMAVFPASLTKGGGGLLPFLSDGKSRSRSESDRRNSHRQGTSEAFCNSKNTIPLW